MSNEKQKIKLDKSTIIILIILAVVILSFIAIKIVESIDFDKNSANDVEIEMAEEQSISSTEDFNELITQENTTESTTQSTTIESKEMPDELLNSCWYYCDYKNEYYLSILSKKVVQFAVAEVGAQDATEITKYSYELQDDKFIVNKNGIEEVYSIEFDISDYSTLEYADSNYIIIKGNSELAKVWEFSNYFG